MSTFPASPSSIPEIANSDSPSAASHKRKRGFSDSDESGSEDRSSEEPDLDYKLDEDDEESRHYTSRKSIGQLEDLLEEMRALPESSQRDESIKDLEEFTKALDSYDFKSCRKHQKCIDQNDLEAVIEMAEGEQFIEQMIRDGLKRAESKFPKNEEVARALSYFMGPSAEAEVKKLVATVTNTMLALGEVNDEDILRRNAEPVIIDLIVNPREEERRAGLEKLFRFNRALW
ncbi:hypothetical protein KCU99_g9594, partial [Aureobasidium melanogenum]